MKTINKIFKTLHQKNSFTALLVIFLLTSMVAGLWQTQPVQAANPSKSTIITDMKSWCDSNDAITSYESIGKTFENNDIWQFKIGTNDSYKIMMDGGMHGMEGGGSMLCYYFAQWLLSGNSTAASLLANAQFIITPIVNYDHSQLPNVGDSTYRKNTNGTYPLGTDLNRNFVNGWSYSSDPTSNYYSGGTAASQNETKAIRAEFTGEQPDIYINYHDFGGDTDRHGWMLFYQGNTSYQERVNGIFGTYAAMCDSLGLLSVKQTFQGAFGSSKDDAYTLTNGDCISINWEITAPSDNPWGSTLISTTKLQHLIVFSTAIVNSLVPDAPPPVLYDSFESGFSSLWNAQFASTSGEGTITTGTSNPHHGSYSLSATIKGGLTDRYACTYKNISSISSAPVYIRAMNVNFNNQPTTAGYAMHCFVPSMGDPTGLNGLAYVGILRNTTHWNYYIRARNVSTFVNFESTLQPAANDTVQMAFYRSTANVGFISLFVNGNLVLNVTNLDNDDRTFNYLHAGAVFSDAAATDSTITMDCVEINTVYIQNEETTPTDTMAPTYSNLSNSTTLAGQACNFNATFADDTALELAIFSFDNGVGSYTNVTTIYPETNPDTISYQVTLNSTVGVTIKQKWYIKDTSNNWNTTTQTEFVTTSLPTYTIDLTINSPTNTTYNINPTVNLASTGNETGITYSYNVRFSNGTATGNLTYSGVTTLIVPSNVSATLYAYAVGDHMSDTAEVSFTVEVIEEETHSYTSTITINAPTNTTYTSNPTLNITWAGNDTNTVLSYDLHFSNGTATGNLSYTAPVALAISENVSCTLYTYAVGDYSSDSAQISFTVTLTEDPEPTPTPSTTDSVSLVSEIGRDVLSAIGLFAVLPLVVGGAVFILVLKGFKNGDSHETILPALLTAVITIIMIEVMTYVAVLVINAFTV